MGTQFEHVAISKKANVYQEGKCISYDLSFPGHTRKTIGVVVRDTVPFRADQDEIMEIVDGHCRVRVGESGAWSDYGPGQRFPVRAHERFELEALEPVHYVCHFNEG
ncbi:MAG TPA: pyrimidine/purine nucleoside phosphorylase [Telluria sp.]|nr:pyrimidine/purine nucleoside phosphorylase [Telluria sp.]